MRRHSNLIAIAVVVVVALGAGLSATRSLILAVDSQRYAMVSQQLCLGRGLRCPVFDLGDRPDSSGTVAFTVQPPLLPIALAGMGGVTPTRLWPARALNVASLVVTCVFSFLIASRLGGRAAGVFAGIAVAVSTPLLSAARYLSTESLFIAFFVASIGCLQASRYARPRWCFLLGSGVAAAAATATRYAGVALLPLFFWEAVVAWKRIGRRRARMVTFLTVPLPLVCLAALWTRNALFTGHVWGFSEPTGQPMAGKRSLIESFQGMIAIAAAQFGIWAFNLKAAIKTALAVILIGAPTGIAAARGRHLTADKPGLLERGLDIVLVAAVAYFGLLTYVQWTQQVVFEYRYATPLVPLLLVAIVSTVARGWQGLRSTRFRHWAHLALVSTLTLIVLYGAGQSLKWFMGTEEQVCKVPTTQTYKWLVTNAEHGAVIATNQPFSVSFFTGHSTLSLPNRSFNPWMLIPQDMDELLPNEMSMVGAKYLVIFSPREGLRADHCGPFVAALSSRKPVSERLTMIWNCADGVVYELKQ